MESKALETHISTLFFTKDRVYKLLKPVSLGFIDHLSKESRIAGAKKELELNQRLAPDVYLGLADVVENGEVVDRFIVMKRLPQDSSLTSIIERGELTEDLLSSIAKKVATFHAALDPILELDAPGCLEVQSANWEDSFAELERFVDSVLDRPSHERTVELVRRYLGSKAHVFQRRIEQGYIRDGHGDMTAADLFCGDDGPQILDCLGFRDDLRVGDVLSDVAFLAMDLHRLAGRDAARLFIERYVEFSGEHHPGSLAHHYVAYRAHVRCKVECLRHEQGEAEAADAARAYLQLALDHLERAQARMILVGGGPGSGKTTMANEIADRFGWQVISSDPTRKDIAGSQHQRHEPARPDEGIYVSEVTEATYAELLRRAELVLDAGESVILDASWTSQDHRQMAAALAEAQSAVFIEFECFIDPEIAKERVLRRLAEGTDDSDATPEIVDHLLSIRSPWPDAMPLDTSDPIELTAERAVMLIEHWQ